MAPCFLDRIEDKYIHIRAVACPEKLGRGGGGAQSNFPTRDHQNICNLILI